MSDDWQARALAAEASVALSARAAVDAARELGHVAAEAVARADAAEARLATVVEAARECTDAASSLVLAHAMAVSKFRAVLDASVTKAVTA